VIVSSPYSTPSAGGLGRVLLERDPSGQQEHERVVATTCHVDHGDAAGWESPGGGVDCSPWPGPLRGWRSVETAKAFADYAGYVAEQLGGAPGLRLSDSELKQVRHHTDAYLAEAGGETRSSPTTS